MKKDMSKIIPDVIYIPNNRKYTSGYDKLYKVKTLVTSWNTWCHYKVSRNNNILQFRLENNRLKSYMVKIYFTHIAEYFAWRLKQDDYKEFKQFDSELKRIENKYPEYFI